MTGTEILACGSGAASPPSAAGAAASGAPSGVSPSASCGCASSISARFSSEKLDTSSNSPIGSSASGSSDATRTELISSISSRTGGASSGASCTVSRIRRTESSLTSGTTFACWTPIVSLSRSSLISIVRVCASCSMAFWNSGRFSSPLPDSTSIPCCFAYGSPANAETGTGATMPSSFSTSSMSTPAFSTASATRRRRSRCNRSKSFATSSSSSAVFSSNSFLKPSSSREISPVASKLRVYSSMGLSWMP